MNWIQVAFSAVSFLISAFGAIFVHGHNHSRQDHFLLLQSADRLPLLKLVSAISIEAPSYRRFGGGENLALTSEGLRLSSSEDADQREYLVRPDRLFLPPSSEMDHGASNLLSRRASPESPRQSTTALNKQRKSPSQRKGIFVCNEQACGKCFAYKSNLRKHEREKHSTVPLTPRRRWSCPSCKSTFSTKEKSKIHQELKHAEIPPLAWQCLVPGCGKSFALRSSLNRHRERSHPSSSSTSSPARHRCSAKGCGKMYKSGSSLKRHVLSKHSANSPPRWPCLVPECGLSFSREEYRNRHYRAHHSENPPRYQCNVEGCAKPSYTIKDSLMRHMKRKHPWMSQKTAQAQGPDVVSILQDMPMTDE